MNSTPEKFEIVFQPGNRRIAAAAGRTIREVAGEAGVPIRGDCGGSGTCGKCRVHVHPASNAVSTSCMNQNGPPGRKPDAQVLACQTRIRGPVTITVPGGVDDRDEIYNNGKCGITGPFAARPVVERLVCKNQPSRRMADHDTGDIAATMIGTIRRQTGRSIFFHEPESLFQLGHPRNFNQDVTLVHHAARGVTALHTGRKTRSLGLALDIGTTTLAAYFCDMKSGEVLCGRAARNPQYRFGTDVLSRIAAADSEPHGLHPLRRCLVQSINRLIKVGLAAIQADREDIDEVTVAGNTAMEQMMAGIHPHGLGRYPYLPVTRHIPDTTAGLLGLDLSPGTNVYFFPVISGFVGGDALAAVLAENARGRGAACLILDIGTNGEILLVNGDRIWATSCATGPAFEGGHLSCGMGAAHGAVSKVAWNGNRLTCGIIGEEDGAAAAGICGSGIIDAVACLRMAGILLSGGRLDESREEVVRDAGGIGRKVILVPAKKDDTGVEVGITLGDIRQVQLAKAAMSVGIDLLMRKAGVRHLDSIVLTGAFGVHFNWQNAVRIGMIPKEIAQSRVVYRENLAGVGAVRALLDGGKRAEAEKIARTIRGLDLAGETGFADQFAAALNFPPLEDREAGKRNAVA